MGPWMGSLGLSTGSIFFYFTQLTKAGMQPPWIKSHGK
jgi:hypothetical protein